MSKSIKGMLSSFFKDDIDAKVKGVMKANIAGKKLYPKAKKDLLQHYFTMQNLRLGQDFFGKEVPIGMPIAIGAGLFKEAIDGIGSIISGRESVVNFGTKGRDAGFSVDDLGANWAGIINMPTRMTVSKKQKKASVNKKKVASNKLSKKKVIA